MQHAKSSSTSTVPDGEKLPVIKGSHVYLIDGSGYIFRAFHALPPLTRPSDGLPVGAVHGFCQMLWKLLRESKVSEAPTHIAVIFDAGRDTFRNDIYPKYKAQRPPPPEELIPQFPLIRDAVKAFNVACIELDRFEADDLIATYAKAAVDAGGDVTIVSSDKDLMQLVRPGVTMFDGMKAKRIGRDEVVEKFGVPPEKVIDVQALAGDSIDNVPGVPGIGIKTAAELIATYGDLDTLLARAGEIKQPKRREKLIEFAEQARVSRQLVTLKDDVPLQITIETFGVQDPNAETLLSYLRMMEFNTLTKRIAEGLGAEAPPPLAVSVGASLKAQSQTGANSLEALEASAPESASPAAAVAAGAALARAKPIDRSRYETVTTRAQLDDWVRRARQAGRVAFDTETTSLDADARRPRRLIARRYARRSLLCAVGAYGSRKRFVRRRRYPPAAARDRRSTRSHRPAARRRVRPEDRAQHQVRRAGMKHHGIEIAPFDDTMLLSYVLDGGRNAHGMDTLAERHLGHTCMSFSQAMGHAPGAKKSEKTFAAMPLDKATEYAAEDADVTLRLWMALKPRLAAERMTTVYETLERALVPSILAMEHAGIKVDRAILSRLSSTFAQRAVRLEEEIYGLAGHKFNLGSPKQLGEFLFDNLKLPGGKRTKSGQWETRANLLDDLAANEELHGDARRLINTMLEWRQMTKLRSTYTDALPEYIDPSTGRIHTSYALAATSTGRLASSDPNLQNIPIRTKEGREIRTAFIADDGMKLVSADYSQIELRVLAHVADIPQLKKAFARRPRHPRDDGIGNVRRAGEGYAE